MVGASCRASVSAPFDRLLGEPGVASRTGVALLWRGRSARHNFGGKNLPHGRRNHAAATDRSRARARDS